ncbi:hypothetical protein CASFOL_004660 [Castilleja foliolosa]|uniref:Uncharacterized protein n=1 Tax=Castilleja foliolosa TaxID=1961234 RepID=A0ABD3EB39_9LAMI
MAIGADSIIPVTVARCSESGKNEQRNVNGWDEDLMQYSKMDKWNIHNRSNLKRARRMDAMFKLRC